MQKSPFKKSKRQRLKIAKRWEALRKHYQACPFAVTIKAACGCCEFTLRFKSKDSFTERWQALGLTSFGEIIDDTGERFTGLDTYYGYVEGGNNDRGIDYLISQIKGKS